MSIVAPIPFTAEGPQPLLREIPPGEAYPVDALGPLRAAVAGAQDITQAPDAIAAQSALAVAALAVQGFADVETPGGRAPVSLFCMTSAESGERKSSCDRLFMGGVRAHEASERERNVERIDAHRTAHDIWTGKRKRLLAEAAGANRLKAQAAESDLRTLGAEPRAPLRHMLTAQDPTMEGLLRLYAEARPSLGLFTDEAGGFIGGHALNPENRLKSAAGLSKLWDGDPVNRVRAGDGVSDYPGRRLSVHMMAQPVAMRPLLADPLVLGQGFLARCLICEPQSRIGHRLRRGHDRESETALGAFAARLRGHLAAPLPTGDDPQALTPRLLKLSAEARGVIRAYGEAVERAQAAGGEMEHVRAFASKSAEQACRIAGVMTLWADRDAAEVTGETMADGIVLAGYYLAEARRLAEAGQVSAETHAAETLRRWLADQTEDDITPSDILRRGPNSLRESRALKPVLAMLAGHGWLAALPAGTVIRGAARREAYRIVRGGHAV